jgi:diguanylate cyclase (GGDEF)-like protein/PAS domain S-box-containing protein
MPSQLPNAEPLVAEIERVLGAGEDQPRRSPRCRGDRPTLRRRRDPLRLRRQLDADRRRVGLAPRPRLRAVLEEYVGCVEAVDAEHAVFVPVVSRGECVLVTRPTSQELAALIRHDGREALALARVRSLMMCPIGVGGRVIGGLSLLRAEDEPELTNEDQQRLSAGLAVAGGELEAHRVRYLAGEAAQADADESARARRFARLRLERDERARGLPGAALRHALDSAAHGVLLADREATTTYANPAARELLGLPEEQIVGRALAELASIETRDALRTALAADVPYAHAALTTADGGALPALCSARALQEVVGAPAGWVVELISSEQDGDGHQHDPAALARGVLDAALDAIVTVETDGTIVGFNPAAERMFGRPAATVLGANAGELLIAEEERTRYFAGIAELALDQTWEAGYRYEIVAVDATGRTFPAEVSISRVAGTPPLITGHIRDLSDRRRRGLQDARIAALTRAALGGGPIDDLLAEALDAIEQTLRPDRAEAWQWCDGASRAVRRGPGGRREIAVDAASLLHPAAEPIRRVQLGRSDITVPGGWGAVGAGEAVLAQVQPARREPMGVLVAVFGPERRLAADELDFLEIVANVLSGAIERRLAEREITFRAAHDPVTGLPNRAVLIDRLTETLADLPAHGGCVGVVVLDIEHLQRVNDTAGHSVGDALLAELAKRLKSVRGPGQTVARLSGDEFAVLLPGADEAAAIEATRCLLEAASGTVQAEGHELEPGLTAGIAIAGDGTTDPHTLLRDADLAKSRVEPGGATRYAMFEPGMRRLIVERMQVEKGLRHALREDGLRLAYQPIVSLVDGRIVGAEALLRWDDPDLGARSPGDVIPIAEDSGLIEPIGRWALAEACRQLARWEAADGIDLRYVAVNVSARQLRDERLVPLLRETLADCAIAPQRIASR